jgi:hypothetical protein
MILFSMILVVIGLFPCWLGYSLLDRSSGRISGVLAGLFMLLLGLALIAAGLLVHGFIPAFV